MEMKKKELTLEEKIKKEKKQTGIVFIIVITGILVAIGFTCLGGRSVFHASETETPIYELTESEKGWLKNVYINEERIEESRLLQYHINEVEKGRYGISVLNEKYPGYEFEITYLEKDTSFDNFSVWEKTTDEVFSMYISENEDGSYEVKDNFYAYLFEDKYETFMEEQIKSKINRTTKVYVAISGVEGKEHNSDMTVEDIVKGKINIYPIINIYISAYDMTEKECIDYSYSVQKNLEDLDLQGVYRVYFWNLLEHDILTKEDLRDESYTYMFILQYFEHKGERM